VTIDLEHYAAPAINPAFAQMVEVTIGHHNGLTNRANEVAAKLLAVDNVGAQIHTVRNESDDPRIVKFRTLVEGLNAEILAQEQAIDAYIKANHIPNVEDIDVPALTAEYNALVGQAKATVAFLATGVIPGVSSLNDLDYTHKLGEERPATQPLTVSPLTKLVQVKHSRSNTKAGDDSTGDKRRLRIADMVIDSQSLAKVKSNPKTGKDYSSAAVTELVQHLNAHYAGHGETLTSLQDKLISAAGTASFATLEGKPFTTMLSLNNEAKSIVEVLVTPAVIVK
jgi:hypothetical protein